MANAILFDALPPDVQAICSFEAAAAGVTLADLLGQSRRKRPTRARHRAMQAVYRLRTAGGAILYSTTMVGRMFGGRDHSTVINALGKTLPRLEPAPVVERTTTAPKRLHAPRRLRGWSADELDWALECLAAGDSIEEIAAWSGRSEVEVEDSLGNLVPPRMREQLAALDAYGSQSAAADALGVSRSAVWLATRKARERGLPVPDHHAASA